MRWRRNKYGNKKVRLDGFLFLSLVEAERYGELKLLQQAGQIEGLAVHPAFTLTINEKYVGDAEFDFSYFRITTAHSEHSFTIEHDFIIEEVKGKDQKTGRLVTDTELSRFKRRVFEALYNKTVTVVEKTGKRGRAARARSEKEWQSKA